MFPSLSAVGSWEEVLLFSMDFSVPKLLGICATECKILLGKQWLAFSNRNLHPVAQTPKSYGTL